MPDGFLGINEPAIIDKRIDAEQLVVGVETVFRERIQITGATAGQIAVVSATFGLQVDTTRIVPGTGAANLGKAEDAVHTSGDVGVLALAVRNDAISALAADGDYIPLIVDEDGKLVVLDPSPTGIEGSPVVVGSGVAVEITFAGVTRTISLKSASTNTGLIFFGPNSITNTGGDAYGELTADASVEIELNDASAPIFVISDTAAQRVYKAALI